MNKPVLGITHHGYAEAGMVAELLAAEQVYVEIREAPAGDSLLDPTHYSGAVIFGGAMNANDEHLDGIAAEIRWT